MKEGPASAENVGAARLLEAARECLAEGRGETVSVRELLSVARVTRPVLYYHFGSRMGLLRAADWSLTAQSETALWRAATLEDSLEERIRRVCCVHAALWRVQSRTIAIVESLVAGGVASGELERVDIRAAALSLVGAATAATALSAYASASTADQIDSAITAVFRGLFRNTKGVLPIYEGSDQRELEVQVRRPKSEGLAGRVRKR